MGINEKIFLAIGGLLLLQILIRKVALSGSALLMRLTAGGLVICMGLGIVWFGSSKNWIGQNIQTYLGGALVGGLILFGLSRWFPQVANFVPKPKPGKCRVCSRLARDVLIVDGGKKAGVFCRRHVIEKFQQAFESFALPMVVFHPEQDRKYCGTMYPYYALGEMVAKFGFDQEAMENVQRILGLIKGKCQRCGGKEATIAYFGRGVLRWGNSGPLLNEVRAEPELLCSSCGAEAVVPSLRVNKEFYTDNGLLVPYMESGVYINTYL